MRSRIVVLIVAVLTIAVLLPLGIVSAHSVQPSTYVYSRLGQATTCADMNFLKGVGDDFTAFGTQMKSLSGGATADIVKASLGISKLRQ